MPEVVSGVPGVESILGHSEREIRRLIRQSAALGPITRRLGSIGSTERHVNCDYAKSQALPDVLEVVAWKARDFRSQN